MFFCNMKSFFEGIVRKKLSNAVDQRDHSTIMRFIKLFPLLGLEGEGLQVYVKNINLENTWNIGN